MVTQLCSGEMQETTGHVLYYVTLAPCRIHLLDPGNLRHVYQSLPQYSKHCRLHLEKRRTQTIELLQPYFRPLLACLSVPSESNDLWFEGAIILLVQLYNLLANPKHYWTLFATPSLKDDKVGERITA